MMKGKMWVILAGLFLVLNGCALKPKYLVDNYAPPQSIALLPMSNLTNDMDGPEVVRQLMFEMLPSRGYSSVTLTQIDDLLREIGITDGGQLRSKEPQELGEKLHVDALLYGELIEFGDINIGFYQNKVVEAKFILIDAATGEKLWEDERKVSKKEFALSMDAAKKKFARGLAKKAVGKMLNIHLKAEATECVRKVVSTLPPNR